MKTQELEEAWELVDAKLSEIIESNKRRAGEWLVESKDSEVWDKTRWFKARHNVLLSTHSQIQAVFQAAVRKGSEA